MKAQVKLGPGVPDLAALGARRVEELLGTDGSLEGEPRAETLERDACSTLLRVPLPGTPDLSGRLTGRPRGAGTGHVLVRRFERAGLRRAFGARLSRPRSASLAAREWNLICLLREHGVTTPEPLAVAALASGAFARRSVLVTRELEGLRPLPEWLAARAGPESRGARRELATALGHALRRAFDAGAWLPRLAPEDVFVGGDEHGGGACSARPAVPVPGLAVSRLPQVALAAFAGGRQLGRIGVRRRARWLGRFARELAGRQPIDPRLAHRVLALALGREPTRAERRAAWRAARKRFGARS